MPNYDDPQILEIISPLQMRSLQDAGYMLVRQKEVRDAIHHTELLDQLMVTAATALGKRYNNLPGSGGMYHLEHRVQIVDGVYEDPDPKEIRSGSKNSLLPQILKS